MKTIITVQHTEAEHHLNGCIGAWQDWRLTERGRDEAYRIGLWLRDAGCGSDFRAYVSPQIRARQTAEEIARTLGIEPVVREELREVNAGEGNGKPREWYRAHEAPRGAAFDPDYRPFPDAESDRELWNRLSPFYRDMMADKAGRILVISHGTTLSFLQSMLLGQAVEDRGRFRFNGSSGSVSRFTVEDSGRVTAQFVNRSVV
jgi:probable phosphoglycerate mutase